MEAASGKSRVRPIVVDFLATLFITFCIGVATAIVLGACVVFMAGDAHGAPDDKTLETVTELVLTHSLATKYAGFIAIDRTPARADRSSPTR
jgi:hypothetical protein